MIVRLKGLRRIVLNEIEREFQFYDSPIKRISAHVYAMPLLNFNSMIVRLKDIVLCIVYPSPIVFQFYDSPIKR